MRLWHKDLISVLPRQQLLSQWRECCCIARNIAINGTPNHILVNKILDYPIEEFFTYGYTIFQEMYRRGYKVNWSRFVKWFDANAMKSENAIGNYFVDWHNDRYLKQCYYNLEEKYDCGGITEDEWSKIKSFISRRIQ